MKAVKYEDVDLHQVAEQLREKQQDDLIIDFDKAVAEEEAKAFMVNFQGNVYKLPRNAPAWLPLFINRHATKEGLLSDEHNLEMIKRLLGKEFADMIVDESNNFVSFEKVNSVILEPVMAKWGMNVRDASEDKDASEKK